MIRSRASLVVGRPGDGVFAWPNVLTVAMDCGAEVEFTEALRTEALLLGRRSYEWFAARWASRSGEWADRLNSLPKYVVSSTLVDPDWNKLDGPKGRGGETA